MAASHRIVSSWAKVESLITPKALCQRRRTGGEIVKISRNSIIIVTAVSLLAWMTAGTATAFDADSVAMERKVRALGTRIGNAYVCTEEKAQAQFEEEAALLFDLIIQDVGSDLAYVYAIGIGSGAQRSKKKLDCPALLKDWGEIRDDYELKGDD
jgi:hypothetical protein